MLGIIENRKPITGEFVGAMREALNRACTGNFTKKEQECMNRERAVEQQYNVIWQ